MSNAKSEMSTGPNDGGSGNSRLRMVMVFVLVVLIAAVVSAAFVALLGYPELAFPQAAVSGGIGGVVTVMVLSRVARR